MPILLSTIEHLKDRARLNELAAIIRTRGTHARLINDTSWLDLFADYVAMGSALVEGRRIHSSNIEFGQWVQREGLWEFGDRWERYALMLLAVNHDRIRRLAVSTTRLSECRTARTIILATQDLLARAEAAPLSTLRDPEESTDPEESIVQSLHNGPATQPPSPTVAESADPVVVSVPEVPIGEGTPERSASTTSPDLPVSRESKHLARALGADTVMTLMEHYRNGHTRAVVFNLARMKTNRPSLVALAEAIRAGRLPSPVDTMLRKVSPRLFGDVLPRTPVYDVDKENPRKNAEACGRLLAMMEDYLRLGAAIRTGEVASDSDTAAKWLQARREQRLVRLVEPLAPTTSSDKPRLAATEDVILFYGKQLWPPTSPTQHDWTFDTVFAAYHFYQHMATNLRTTNAEEQALTISQLCKWLNAADAAVLVSVLQHMISAVRSAHGDATVASKTRAPALLPSFA
jgi:hypothetical protein